MTYQPGNANVTTGVIAPCVITINADPTKFDVSAGTCVIEDWSNPAEKRTKFLTYPGVTGQLPPNPTTNIFTSVALIESSTEGVAELQLTSEQPPTARTRREQVALVTVLHPFGDGVISGFTDAYQIAFGWAQTFNDMNQCRRACISGNMITANGANLSLDRAAGTTSLPFFNAASSAWIDPAIRANASQAVHEFIYQAQAPAGPFVGNIVTVVDPNNYDNNGVITPVPNNRWTVQRLYFFGQSSTMTISYGQEIYSSQSAALDAVDVEIFAEPPNTVVGVWLAALVLKDGTTDLSDSENTIINKQANSL